MNFIKGLWKSTVTIWFSMTNLFVLLPVFAAVGLIVGAGCGLCRALKLWGWNVQHREVGNWTLFPADMKKEDTHHA